MSILLYVIIIFQFIVIYFQYKNLQRMNKLTYNLYSFTKTTIANQNKILSEIEEVTENIKELQNDIDMKGNV